MSEPTEIVPREVPQRTSLARRGGLEITDAESAVELAKLLAQGSLMPRSLQGPADVLYLMLAGAELGIGPAASIRSLHVVDGKVGMSAELMLARAAAQGLRWTWVETTNESVTLRLVRPGWEPHEETFTMADARRAGLAKRKNWEAYPRNMLRARCISNALRAYAPDLLAGGGVYDVDELEDVRERDNPHGARDEYGDEAYERAKGQEAAGIERAEAWWSDSVGDQLKTWRDAAAAGDEEVRAEVAEDLYRWVQAEAERIEWINAHLGRSNVRARLFAWLGKVLEATGSEDPRRDLRAWLDEAAAKAGGES